MAAVKTLRPIRHRIDEILSSVKIDRTTDEGSVEDKNGRPFRRIDFGLTGSLDGYVTLAGPLAETAQDAYSMLTDVPSIILPQEHLLVADPSQPYPLPVLAGHGNDNPPVYVQGTFKAEDGAGMTIFVPQRAADWNGKLFIVQRGAGVFPPLQPLVGRRPEDVFTRGLGRNAYLELIMDKGYAVAWFRRDASRPPEAVSTAVTEDSTVLRASQLCHVALLLAMVEFSQGVVTENLGARPSRTYYYGHSGGGIIGRLTNYAPGANRSKAGVPIIDGFIDDDSGNGLFLPLAFSNGRDELFRLSIDREAFVPQIDLARPLYHPLSFLQAKRENARLLREKGLGEKHRYYEIRGTSHFDAGMASMVGITDKAGKLDSLDLGGLIEALIDLLDDWVEKGIEPPASKADLPDYEPAISLPEVSCPLGVYYAGPPGSGRMAAALTGFAPFDGVSPEPISSATGSFVDMNGNGVADKRETIAQAWRRLGLLEAGEDFTRERYVKAMREAAAALVKERLLPARLESWYEIEALRLLEEVESMLRSVNDRPKR